MTEKYLWADLTTLLAIYGARNDLIARFEYADGRMPYKMVQDIQTYYLSYDQVGTLKAVVREDGTIVKTIGYDTFGRVLYDSNASLKVPFGFAGGLYDEDTKLTRFGYRDYDAETGKWTAKDPIGFNGGDTNLYGYVLGDPVNFIDPEGKTPAVAFTAGAGAVVGGLAGLITGGAMAILQPNASIVSVIKGAALGLAGGVVAGAMAGIGNMPGASSAWAWIGAGADLTINAYNGLDAACSDQGGTK